MLKNLHIFLGIYVQTIPLLLNEHSSNDMPFTIGTSRVGLIIRFLYGSGLLRIGTQPGPGSVPIKNHRYYQCY